MSIIKLGVLILQVVAALLSAIMVVSALRTGVLLVMLLEYSVAGWCDGNPALCEVLRAGAILMIIRTVFGFIFALPLVFFLSPFEMRPDNVRLIGSLSVHSVAVGAAVQLVFPGVLF